MCWIGIGWKRDFSGRIPQTSRTGRRRVSGASATIPVSLLSKLFPHLSIHTQSYLCLHDQPLAVDKVSFPPPLLHTLPPGTQSLVTPGQACDSRCNRQETLP